MSANTCLFRFINEHCLIKVATTTGFTEYVLILISADYSMGSTGEGLAGGGPGGGGNLQHSYSPQPSPHHWSQGSLTTGIPPGGGNMHQMPG